MTTQYFETIKQKVFYYRKKFGKAGSRLPAKPATMFSPNIFGGTRHEHLALEWMAVLKNGRKLEAREKSRQDNEQPSNPVCRASSLGEVRDSGSASYGRVGGGQVEAAADSGKAGGQRASWERDDHSTSARRGTGECAGDLINRRSGGSHARQC